MALDLNKMISNAQWPQPGRLGFFCCVVLVSALALPAAAQVDPDVESAGEPDTFVYFGSNWLFVDPAVDALPDDWRTPDAEVLSSLSEPYDDPDADVAVAPPWQIGSAPFIGRSEATAQEIRAQERRRRRRRRRRHRPDPPPFGGTILTYDHTVFDSPPDSPENFEPGPNTYVFQQTFEVGAAGDSAITNLSEVRALFLEVRFSGGFVAYLNGRELARHNVLPGTETDAPADIEWLPSWVAQTVGNVWQRAFVGLDSSALRLGRNLLSFEVRRRPHSGSKPMYFDAQMRLIREFEFIKTAYLQEVQQDGITVMWETSMPSVGYVEYGAGEWLEQVATSPRVASNLHEVRLTGLLPGQRYFYRVHSLPVDDDLEPLSGPIEHFRTSVTRGERFSFLLYGDNRTNSSVHSRLVEAMQETAEQNDVRFIVNTGDLTTRGSWWDEWQAEFFEPALPLMARYPLYAVLGNHEGNHETFYEYLSLPNNESWYSFSYGDADFFGINSSTGFDVGTPQYEWLDAALAASEAAWQLVMFHHPPFSCVPGRKPGSLRVQEQLVPLLERHGVDLVLLGHDHLYGRSVPINGVTYVISGGGGASTYPAEPDEINEICVRTHHYCILHISDVTLELEAIDIDGELLDTLVLTPETRNHPSELTESLEPDQP